MNFIDLFAGAGGMSEGFTRAGFNPLVHVEMDGNACATLRTRTVYHALKAADNLNSYWEYTKGERSQEELYAEIDSELLRKVIHAKIDRDTIEGIFENVDAVIGEQPVDLIVGGPPCQAYSMIGRSRDPNGMKGDERNHLFRYYAKFLEKYQPKVFVFENVAGLLSAKNGEYLRKMRADFGKKGYRTDIRTLISSDFGVVQNRKRVIIIGWQEELKFQYPDFNIQRTGTTVNELLVDLPALEPGDKFPFKEYTQIGTDYLYKNSLRNGQPFVTQNYTRWHNDRDLEIYRRAIELWVNERKRLHYDELPEKLKTHKNRTAFVDRYKVVNGEGKSHTVVAHLAKDGHYFIKPDLNQVRSLSCREAARI
ncbi:MAG TPA: DNA cytosine methyltransferase, partial [Bacteroidetes bacterium]|nr:DNA cytosine methyltransferase [Bacteroidota bacterium]